MYRVLGIFFVFFYGFACDANMGFKDLPSPYNSLEEILPKNDLGWFSESNQKELSRLMKGSRPRVVVELGCQLGKATCFIAKQLPPEGKVYAVDTWKGTPEIHFAYSSLLPKLYKQFLSNVIHEKLQDKIHPVSKDFLAAASEITEEIDMVYFNSFYDEFTTYSYLTVWYPRVKGRGVLCGDKWSWGPYVGRISIAVKKFCKDNNLRYKTNGWFWVIYE